jgi:hypothetical protein
MGKGLVRPQLHQISGRTSLFEKADHYLRTIGMAVIDGNGALRVNAPGEVSQLPQQPHSPLDAGMPHRLFSKTRARHSLRNKTCSLSSYL